MGLVKVSFSTIFTSPAEAGAQLAKLM